MSANCGSLCEAFELMKGVHSFGQSFRSLGCNDNAQGLISQLQLVNCAIDVAADGTQSSAPYSRVAPHLMPC